MEIKKSTPTNTVTRKLVDLDSPYSFTNCFRDLPE